MKKVTYFILILGILATIGFSLVGCDNIDLYLKEKQQQEEIFKHLQKPAVVNAATGEAIEFDELFEFYETSSDTAWIKEHKENLFNRDSFDTPKKSQNSMAFWFYKKKNFCVTKVGYYLKFKYSLEQVGEFVSDEKYGTNLDNPILDKRLINETGKYKTIKIESKSYDFIGKKFTVLLAVAHITRKDITDYEWYIDNIRIEVEMLDEI